jgi:YbbR domain-containing protein
MPFRRSQREIEGRLPQILLRWLRQFLFRDWGMKLLALAITIGLWYGVTGQREPTTIRLRNVQLRFLLPVNMEISNSPREEVDIVLTGSKQALGVINVHNPVASVDVHDYQPGERALKLTKDRITMELPSGVSIDNVEPNVIPFHIEARIQREIEVEPQFIGRLPEGYELLSFQCVPSKVRVRGPESIINKLTKVDTEKIPLDGRTKDFDVLQVAIDIPSRPGQRVDSIDTVVTLNVKVGEQRIEKIIQGVLIKPSTDATEYVVSPTTSVTIYGPWSIVNSLNPADIRLNIEKSSEGKEHYQLILPPAADGKVELRSVSKSGKLPSR